MYLNTHFFARRSTSALKLFKMSDFKVLPCLQWMSPSCIFSLVISLSETKIFFIFCHSICFSPFHEACRFWNNFVEFIAICLAVCTTYFILFYFYFTILHRSKHNCPCWALIALGMSKSHFLSLLILISSPVQFQILMRKSLIFSSQTCYFFEFSALFCLFFLAYLSHTHGALL